jgi:uncharacterized membrane protein YjgN (DUF898 family)
MDGMIELSVDRPRVVEPFEFTGSGVEYFRIWIVNLALSIATLGIYSAWAKVRRTQYFYRHTHVAGARFQYLGRPGAILKGRIVAAILFGTYTAAGQLSPFYGLAAFGVLALVMPWLLARSFRFRLSNTSYRGIRFGFAGSTAGSYGVFLGLPLLTVLTLFVLGPFTHHRIKKYQIGQARFGQTSIAFLSRVSEFYIAYVAAGFLTVVLIGFPVAVIAGIRVFVESNANPLDSSVSLWNTMSVLGFIFAYAFGLIAAQALVTSRIQNEIWSNAWVGRHNFVSSIQTLPLFRILFSNLALTLITLGLYRPFAQIRLAKYLLGALSLVRAGSLDDLEAGEMEAHGAFGEEAAAFFDFDIAF